MVKLRFCRRERAIRFGRYLNLRAAAQMRSWVTWGMDLAPGERLITSEIVAVERPRCSASAFMLIEAPAGSPEISSGSFLARAMGLTSRSLTYWRLANNRMKGKNSSEKGDDLNWNCDRIHLLNRFSRWAGVGCPPLSRGHGADGWWLSLATTFLACPRRFREFVRV